MIEKCLFNCIKVNRLSKAVKQFKCKFKKAYCDTGFVRLCLRRNICRSIAVFTPFLIYRSVSGIPYLGLIHLFPVTSCSLRITHITRNSSELRNSRKDYQHLYPFAASQLQNIPKRKKIHIRCLKIFKKPFQKREIYCFSCPFKKKHKRKNK